MKEYIQYLQHHFGKHPPSRPQDHPHLKIAIKVLESLDYIENNMNELTRLVGTSHLWRHPKNHLSIHLSHYKHPN